MNINYRFCSLFKGDVMKFSTTNFKTINSYRLRYMQDLGNESFQELVGILCRWVRLRSRGRRPQCPRSLHQNAKLLSNQSYWTIRQQHCYTSISSQEAGTCFIRDDDDKIKIDQELACEAEHRVRLLNP